MILIFHQNNKVKCLKKDNDTIEIQNTSIVKSLFILAQRYPDEKIIWCHSDLKNSLNLDFINESKINVNSIHSYSTTVDFYLHRFLGYIDQNSILKINKEVIFPTWMMSSDVGMVTCELVNRFSNFISKNEFDDYKDFDFFLNSISFRTRMNGVFTYSNPKLLKTISSKIDRKSEINILFKFVKKHYSFKWYFILFFAIFIFNKKIFIGSFLKNLFRKKYVKIEKDFTDILFKNAKSKDEYSNVKVNLVIPTIGREKYLNDFLIDLKKQELLPTKVIVVEQNPIKNSLSNLDFLKSENWPFQIELIFINQPGACNARNLALQKVDDYADYIFFADDDIRINSSFLSDAIHKMFDLNTKAVMFACLLPHQKNNFLIAHQTVMFGSGCSIVSKELCENIFFDKNYEFNFGEDYDYGMQLRNKGTDIVYMPFPEIIHLKAPIGGFRTKPILLWEHEIIKPKPSPTILLNYLKYSTKEQIKGYKFVFLIKNWNFKDVLTLFKLKRAQWGVSEKWAIKLLNND